jgi:inosose dehydratase
MRLGSAPDSWGVWFADDPKQVPWTRFLDELAEVGYRWTELGPYGYLPTSVEELRAELARRELKVAAGFVKFDLEAPGIWEAAEREVEDTCMFVRTVGGEYLVIIDELYTDEASGAARFSPELNDDEWRRLVAATERVNEAARRHDLRPVFHPHAETHVEYESQIERLLDDVDGLELCFDVGHHAYCGGDAVAFFTRHSDRIPYLHLKSVDADLLAAARERGLSFAAAVAEGVFVEPALGVVDFVALRDVIAEQGYDGYAIVEQDMYPVDPDRPLPIAKRTYEYLTELGFG